MTSSILPRSRLSSREHRWLTRTHRELRRRTKVPRSNRSRRTAEQRDREEDHWLPDWGSDSSKCRLHEDVYREEKRRSPRYSPQWSIEWHWTASIPQTKSLPRHHSRRLLHWLTSRRITRQYEHDSSSCSSVNEKHLSASIVSLCFSCRP